MKKLIFSLFLIILTLTVCVTANARNIFDYTYILEDYDFDTVSYQFEQEYNVSIKVFTFLYSPDWDAVKTECSQDWDDSVALVISIHNDESYMEHTVYSENKQLFDSDACKKIEKQLKPILSLGNYFGATQKFFNLCRKHIEEQRNQTDTNKITEALFQNFTLLIGCGISLAVAFSVALSAVIAHKRKLKTVWRATDAFSYIDKEYLQITFTKDQTDDLFSLLFL